MDQLRLLCVCCRVWMSATALRVWSRVVFITQPPVNLNLDFQENIIIHLSISSNQTAKISQQHRILIRVSFHVIALSWDILFFQTFVTENVNHFSSVVSFVNVYDEVWWERWAQAIRSPCLLLMSLIDSFLLIPPGSKVQGLSWISLSCIIITFWLASWPPDWPLSGCCDNDSISS